MRRLISLTAMLSFIFTVVTSVILYISPLGRIAFWADWTLWGLSKEQWGDLHVTVGTLLLIALVLHVYYNWKSIVAYLSQSKKVVIFTRDFNVALVIVLVVCFGTYANVPPFSSILELSESIKNKATITYGEPPYGHAELTPLAQLAPKIGMTPEQMVTALANAGYAATSQTTSLLELARKYKVSPQQVYKALQLDAPAGGMPATPPTGTGNLSLDTISTKYGLDTQQVVQFLAKNGVTAQGEMTLKVIGEKNNKGSSDIYNLIRMSSQ